MFITRQNRTYECFAAEINEILRLKICSISHYDNTDHPIKKKSQVLLHYVILHYVIKFVNMSTRTVLVKFVTNLQVL